MVPIQAKTSFARLAMGNWLFITITFHINL